MKLRVASYNIRKCIGLDRKRRPLRIANVINKIEADVIVLQEADKRLGVRPAALPHAIVAQETDYTVVELSQNDVSLGWHGNAILLRKEFSLESFSRIKLPGFEPRGAVLAEIAGASGMFRIIGTHLGLARRHRRRQLTELQENLAVRKDMPTILLGDFNEWSKSRGMEPLEGHFEVHSPGRSFHAARPIAALDRIALNPLVELRDAGVVETLQSRIASDHLPVWADVTLRAHASAD
ncbi:endonuclease/exonuclease/phosphatase family protein [Pseudohalocynthiibacter sp. F2068]|jgi:endonuclease/exonuclease/phosphatase family metal-dependent hydrolase|uniref:endonuclease/exonuclease/phosphatase family protein n=1 Tax=Pseudohalocynthiibacter sp. F2068 TaxID=2926418 RepID=UPI001FF58081|nr:endonuclease/exonuclease/phosphatase family protein [Pseudohalocynthiibacter sp. F2068]MCK0101629.1 endonuclease/exonuclease/phosphatase family protein [Pseudohalocynthiibacter sp. F2068]